MAAERPHDRETTPNHGPWTMRMNLRTKGILPTRNLREHVERHVRFALGRFRRRVRDVKVQLVDENGPRGGEDVRCKIRARLEPRGELVVEGLKDDPYAAVALASDRIETRLYRHVDRLRARKRRQAVGAA